MASIKLNYGNHNPRIQRIERGKPNRATIDRELLTFADQRAFVHVPQIVHLNFLHAYGLFRAYPGMAGKGDRALAGRYFAHKTGAQHRVPNPNDPRLVGILAEWLEDMRQSAPHWWPPSNGGGAGGSRGAEGTGRNVSITDQQGLNSNIEAIAKGEVSVTD